MKKNILSIILAFIMILAVCPVYAEAAHVPGDYIINDDFSDATAERTWLTEYLTNKKGQASSEVVDGKVQMTQVGTDRAGTYIYFNEDKEPITRPTAISFTVNKQEASFINVYSNSSYIYSFWYGSEKEENSNKIQLRSYASLGAAASTPYLDGVYPKGTDTKFTYVIDPMNYTYSLWINDDQKVENGYFSKSTTTSGANAEITNMIVLFNSGNKLAIDDDGNTLTEDAKETSNTVTIDDVKVWDFVKGTAVYSGTGYNNGTLQAGNIALSLPISYIPNGTDNKVTVLMAAYDKATNKLIAISDIEQHTFDGADFFTYTPEMTIPQSAGAYYVKTMVWKSNTMVPLCAAEVIE